jgi:hypothetical protein
MLSGCGFLNSILALMNYLVVAAIFLELVVAAEWFESLETEDRTVAKAAKMIVPIELLNRDWAWLRTYELWLPEVWTELVRHRRDNAHHNFLLLNSCYVLFRFWARFGAMTPAMISAVEVWISWIMVLYFLGSSSPSSPPRHKTSSCVWSVVLIELGVFYIIDVSWSLKLRSHDIPLLPCLS